LPRLFIRVFNCPETSYRSSLLRFAFDPPAGFAQTKNFFVTLSDPFALSNGESWGGIRVE